MDIVAFKESMLWARKRLEDVFQKPVAVADTTVISATEIHFTAPPGAGTEQVQVVSTGQPPSNTPPLTYRPRPPGPARRVLGAGLRAGS